MSTLGHLCSKLNRHFPRKSTLIHGRWTRLTYPVFWVPLKVLGWSQQVVLCHGRTNHIQAEQLVPQEGYSSSTTSELEQHGTSLQRYRLSMSGGKVGRVGPLSSGHTLGQTHPQSQEALGIERQSRSTGNSS